MILGSYFEGAVTVDAKLEICKEGNAKLVTFAFAGCHDRVWRTAQGSNETDVFEIEFSDSQTLAFL